MVARAELLAPGTIFNTMYVFPTGRLFPKAPHPGGKPKRVVIVEPCKLTLPTYGLTLLFVDNRIIFFKHSDKTPRLGG